MARRFYIAPIIGDGKSPETAYRAKVADFGVPYATIIPGNPDGTPKFNWALCLVAGDKHSEIAADPDIRAIPNGRLDDPLSTFSVAVRTALRNQVEALGVDVTGITAQSTLRDVIRRIGRHLEAGFDEAKFGVNAA